MPPWARWGERVAVVDGVGEVLVAEFDDGVGVVEPVRTPSTAGPMIVAVWPLSNGSGRPSMSTVR